MGTPRRRTSNGYSLKKKIEKKKKMKIKFKRKRFERKNEKQEKIIK